MREGSNAHCSQDAPSFCSCRRLTSRPISPLIPLPPWVDHQNLESFSVLFPTSSLAATDPFASSARKWRPLFHYSLFVSALPCLIFHSWLVISRPYQTLSFTSHRSVCCNEANSTKSHKKALAALLKENAPHIKAGRLSRPSPVAPLDLPEVAEEESSLRQRRTAEHTIPQTGTNQEARVVLGSDES